MSVQVTLTSTTFSWANCYRPEEAHNYLKSIIPETLPLLFLMWDSNLLLIFYSLNIQWLISVLPWPLDFAFFTISLAITFDFSPQLFCFSPKLYCFGSHLLNTSFNLVVQPSDVCITQRQCFHQAHPIPSVKMSISGLPWWFSGWEFTTSEVHMGLIPVPGRVHMTWGIWTHVPQLLKPRCLRACVLQ